MVTRSDLSGLWKGAERELLLIKYRIIAISGYDVYPNKLGANELFVSYGTPFTCHCQENLTIISVEMGKY